MGKRFIPLVAVFIFLTLLLSGLLVHQAEASPDWWNTDWSCRKAITISNSLASALTNYQIKIDVAYESAMQASFDDLQFTNASDAPLDYWLESKTDSSLATVWVEVDSIAASGNTTIYVYYGNPTASSASDGTTTFLFFNDFSGDLSKWEKQSTSGEYPKIEGGYLRCGGGTTGSPYGWTCLGSRPTYTGFQDNAVEFRYRVDSNAICEVSFRGNYASNTGYKGRSDQRSGEGQSFLKPPYRVGLWGFISPGQDGDRPSINVWYRGTITASGSTFNLYRDGVLKRSVSDSQYSGPGQISLQNHYGSYTDYDWVVVRKFTTPELTYSVGSEECLPIVTIDVSDTLINEADDGGTFDVVATFSKAMDTGVTPTISFDPDVVASGTLTFASGVWNGGDKVYTVTYDVADVDEEVADVDVSVGGAKDVAGNPQDPDPTTEADLFDVDTLAPTVAITSTAPDPTGTSPIPMTALFSENVTGFELGDITVVNGAADNFVAVSGAEYTFDVTPVTDGLVTVDIAGGVAQDDAGNPNNAAVQFSIAYDTTAPTVVIASTSTDPTNVSPILMTATFSEDVTGFVVGDITVGNGTAGNFAGGPKVYTFDVTPTGQGVVTVDIAGGVAQDAAGNGNTAAAQLSRTYDSVAPTVTAVDTTKADGSYKQGEVIDITVTYDEVVNVTGAPTLALNSGGTASYNSGSGTQTLTFSYTVGAGENSADLDYVAANSLALNGGTIRDAALNDANNTLPAVGTFASAHAIVIDTTVPDVTINQAAGQADPTNSSPINFAVVFSESVADFDSGDVTLSSGTATVTGSGTTYNVAVSGMSDGVLTASIAADVAHDAADNGNTASTSIDNNVTYDTTAPDVAINAPDGGENWPAGTNQNITWTASDNFTPAANLVITIEYSTDNGGNWTAVATSEVNDGSYTWLVPNNLSTNCLVRVSTVDEVGNPGSDVSNAVFSIVAPGGGWWWAGGEGDVTPPIISNVGNYPGGVTETTAVVCWTTNELSTSQVEYWASPSVLSPLDERYVTEHHVELTGLTPGTTYHYKAMSKDRAGNLAVSPEYSFPTLGKAPVAAFTSSNLSISPSEVDIGGSVTISVLVTNSGSASGSYKVTLNINGVVEETKDITLDAGASEKVTFTTSKDKPATCSVDVNGVSGSFRVKEGTTPAPVSPTPMPTPEKPFNWPRAGGIVAGLIVVGLVLFMWLRRRLGY